MPYYRQSISFGPPLRGAVRQLVITTGVAFLVTYIPAQIFGWALPFAWFGLQPYDVTHHLFIWQVVTYLFLHGGWFHIIFNLFALWMFGSDLESLWGSRRFLTYYFLTGVGAGMFVVVIQSLFPPALPVSTIGCSGAVMGLLLAYGITFPDLPIFLYFIIPIKAKWFVVIMGLIEFVSALQPSSGVSNVAHLGGLLVGLLYLRGRGLPYELQSHYHDWRRARLRRKFEVYMRKREGKDDTGRWIN
jgi:membrane associated rhomboid family serine protease